MRMAEGQPGFLTAQDARGLVTLCHVLATASCERGGSREEVQQRAVFEGSRAFLRWLRNELRQDPLGAKRTASEDARPPGDEHSSVGGSVGAKSLLFDSLVSCSPPAGGESETPLRPEESNPQSPPAEGGGVQDSTEERRSPTDRPPEERGRPPRHDAGETTAPALALLRRHFSQLVTAVVLRATKQMLLGFRGSFWTEEGEDDGDLAHEGEPDGLDRCPDALPFFSKILELEKHDRFREVAAFFDTPLDAQTAAALAQFRAPGFASGAGGREGLWAAGLGPGSGPENSVVSNRSLERALLEEHGKQHAQFLRQLKEVLGGRTRSPRRRFFVGEDVEVGGLLRCDFQIDVDGPVPGCGSSRSSRGEQTDHGRRRFYVDLVRSVEEARGRRLKAWLLRTRFCLDYRVVVWGGG